LGQSDEPELSSEHRQILLQDVQDSDPKRYP
jgi:hypothetical protein